MQKTLERLDEAFRAFFRRVRAGEMPGYPRYRSGRRFNTLRAQHGHGCKLLDSDRSRNARLYWAGVGEIKANLHRSLPDDARLTEVQIKRQADGWYVCLALEVPTPIALRESGLAIGIDLGVASFATLSSGEKVAGPRAHRKAERRVARLQRELARTDRSSHRRRTAQGLLSKARLKEARVRRDHHHKLARRLVREFDVIYLEDLNVRGLSQSSLAKDVNDQGWGQFERILTDKAEEAGRQLVLVDPRGSSQECSGCGGIVKKPLSERVHRCVCGTVLDRDVNAARVILGRGKRQRDTLADVGHRDPTNVERGVGRNSVPSAGHGAALDRHSI